MVEVDLVVMGKGRDKRKRAKDKKAVSDTSGNAAPKETGAAKTARKTQANAAKRENRAVSQMSQIRARQ